MTGSRTTVFSSHAHLLQRRWLDEVAGSPLVPSLVVAPTQRLLDHLAAQAAARLGAVADLRFLHHQGLAREILYRSRAAPFARLPEPIAARDLCEELRPEQSALDRYLWHTPRALTALAATCRDLRDAGWFAAEPPRCLGRLGLTARATIELFVRVQARWLAHQEHRRGDAAALAFSGMQTLAQNGEILSGVILYHYGAYDLIGVHQQLIEAAERRCTVRHYVPIAEPSAGSGSVWLDRLRLPAEELHDRRSAPLSGALVDTGTPRQELQGALRKILDWHLSDGIALEELAVLTRRGEKFQPFAAAELVRLGLQADVSFAGAPRAFQDVARALRLLDAFVDQHRIDAQPLRELAVGAGGLPQRWETAREPAVRCELFAELADQLGLNWWSGELSQLSAAFAECPGAGGARDWPWVHQKEALRQEVERSFPRPRVRGCLRLLDWAQARGLPFQRAVAIGFNAGDVPLVPGEDPFLPDVDRLLLREELGIDLRLRSAAAAEELRLAQCIRGGIGERLDVSFHRTDSLGRVATVSPWLETWFPVPGPTHRISEPTHPRHALSELLAGTHLLDPGEALCLRALTSAQPVPALLALHGLRLDLPWSQPALLRLAAIELWNSRSLPYDGDLDQAIQPESWSATSLQRLGRCPLQFLFDHLWRVNGPKFDEFDVDHSPLEIGNLAHAILERAYAPLCNAEPSSISDARIEEVVAALPGTLERVLEAAAPESFRGGLLPPRLTRMRLSGLLESLRSFVRADLKSLRAEQHRIERLEQPLAALLQLPGSEPLALRARLDRVESCAEGLLIVDYKWKTGDRLKQENAVLEAVRGRQLQLPLYVWAGEAQGWKVAAARAISLREPPGAELPVQVTWTSTSLRTLTVPLQQALATLVEIPHRGRFPLNSDLDAAEGHCGRCPYARACRHRHRPTIDRVEAHPAHRDYFELAAKGLSTVERNP